MKKDTIIILINIAMVCLIIIMQYKYLKYNSKIKEMIININSVNKKIERINGDKAVLENELKIHNKDLENIKFELKKIEDDLDAAREKLNSL